jgi:hypothetical protein
MVLGITTRAVFLDVQVSLHSITPSGYREGPSTISAEDEEASGEGSRNSLPGNWKHLTRLT